MKILLSESKIESVLHKSRMMTTKSHENMTFCPLYVDLHFLNLTLESSIDTAFKKNPNIKSIVVQLNDDPICPSKVYIVKSIPDGFPNERDHNIMLGGSCMFQKHTLTTKGYEGSELVLVFIDGVKPVNTIHSVLPNIFDIHTTSVNRSYLLVKRDSWEKRTDIQYISDKKKVFANISVSVYHLKQLLEENFLMYSQQHLFCHFNDDVRIPRTLLCFLKEDFTNMLPSLQSLYGEVQTIDVTQSLQSEKIQKAILHIVTGGDSDSIAERIMFSQHLDHHKGNITVYMELIGKVDSKEDDHESDNEKVISWLKTNPSSFPMSRKTTEQEKRVRRIIDECIKRTDVDTTNLFMTNMTKLQSSHMKRIIHAFSKRIKSEDQED